MPNLNETPKIIDFENTLFAGQQANESESRHLTGAEFAEKLKRDLTINGQRIRAVDTGALPSGPEGQDAYMEVTAVGTWTYGGSPVGTNADGYKTTFWWDGDTETWENNGSVRIKADEDLETAKINKGKSYPFVNQPTLTPAITKMNNALLNIIVEELSLSTATYQYTIALIARNATVGDWGNAIVLRRLLTSTLAVFDSFTFKQSNLALSNEDRRQLGKLSLGGLQTITLQGAWSKKIVITIDTDELTNGEVVNTSYADPEGNKMYFDASCFRIIQDVPSRAEFNSEVNTITSVKNWKDDVVSATINQGKSYPLVFDSSASSSSTLVLALKDVILDASIDTTDDLNLYTYELAYLNINRSRNTERFDNTIQLIRRERGNINAIFMEEFNNIEGFFEGYLFQFVWDIGNAKVRFMFNGATTYIGQQNFSNTSARELWGKQWLDIAIYKKSIAQDIVVQKKHVVKRVGDNLYIGSKFDAENDILIHFRKCMFNDLMTFYNVGLAPNTSVYPLLNPDRATTTVLNQSSSDNIGPLNIDANLWAGGNHGYPDSSGVVTAETLSFEFKADGFAIADGVIQADYVEVSVINNIYNPTLPNVDGDLDQLLCTEKVFYKIDNGNIEVSLLHSYVNSSPVALTQYYGMQSMFSGETEIMTPRGLYTQFTPVLNPMSFVKSAYPKFDRFIEKKGDLCQSTYLLPIDNGTHNLLASGTNIFLRTGTKSYHRILNAYNPIAGDKVSWSGVYTWFKPLVNNDNVLIYSARSQGNDVLFIDTKGVFTGNVEIPEYVFKSISVIDADTTITIGNTITAMGLSIDSSVASTAVLKLL